MAGYLVTNAQPRGYALGFKDESRKEMTPERITTPQFYPLLWVLAERTYDEAVIISGNGEHTLGKKTFQKGSAFYTHQNAFAKQLLKKQNQFVVETIKLPGSSKAFLRVSIEVVPSDIPLYKRVEDETQGRIGEYLVDEYGSYIQDGYVLGSKLVHHVGKGHYAEAQREFGAAKIQTCRPAGTIVGGRLLSSISASFPVSGNIVVGTAYTNSTTRMLNVVVSTEDVNIKTALNVLIDNVVVVENKPINKTSRSFEFTVPVGSTYKLVYGSAAVQTNVVDLDVTTTEQTSAATTLYPIADIEINHYGASGNLIGLSILSPTTQDDNGPFVSDIKLNRAVPYRIMTQTKESVNSSPTPSYMLTGDQAIDVTLKQDAISALSKNPISLVKTFVQAYSSKATINRAAVYGEWGRVKVYEQSLEILLSMLANGYTVTTGTQMVDIEGEGAFDDDAVISRIREDWALLSDPLNSHLVNIFSAHDHNGIPYMSFNTSESVALGGVSFDAKTPQYATGGSDGTYFYADGRPATEINAKVFDDAVRNSVRNFGQGTNKYKDALKYPISCIIDSGFSLETKLEFPTILIRRPDMWVMAATHSVYDVGMRPDPAVRSIYRDGNVEDVSNIINLQSDWGLCPQQSQVREDAFGAALRAAFNTTMESDYWGTDVTRAVIRGQSGTVIDSDIWDGCLPLTYELMCQLSDFAGDPSGIWRDRYDFTIEPNNVIKLMENINNTYRENTSYSKLWDIGVNWTSSYDQFRYYTPAVQTVYPYDDSILNSAKLMMACCRLEYLNLIVHARMTGRDDLTDAEFIQRCREIANEEAEGIFAGRYIVESKPEIQESDAQKGYIWRNFYHIYGNVMKTVMIYGVIARRMSDYTGSSN